MTVQEFYEYCKSHGVEDFKIFVDQISTAGCFVGYNELTKDKIDIGYSEKIVSLGQCVFYEIIRYENVCYCKHNGRVCL